MAFISAKWKLTVRVVPFVALAVAAKLAAHYGSVELFSLSPLFGAIISANVFLIGFLISGVLVDYKESERLPGELACSFEVLADEASILAMSGKDEAAGRLLAHVRGTLAATLAWFVKEEHTSVLTARISGFNAHFLALEPLTQANFIARLKQEQHNIRRIVTRVHTIRETDFNPSGYAIAEVMSLLLSVGLIFTAVEPFYQSMFFIMFVTFVQVYMILLIRDLDNPFAYYNKGTLTENVSLKPLYDLQQRLGQAAGQQGSALKLVPQPGGIAAPRPKSKRRR
jgi:hypothetical protein